jgi:glyoxylase I family protein
MGMIRGIHHFGLTVRDVDATAAWHQDVLGFERAGSGRRTGRAARCFAGTTDYKLARAYPAPGGSQDAFDETQAGLDHLGPSETLPGHGIRAISRAGLWLPARRIRAPAMK